MNPADRAARWVIVTAGLVILAALGGRLTGLFHVNRMAVAQLQGKSVSPTDLGPESDWFLPGYVAGRGQSLQGSFAAAISLLEKAHARRPKDQSVLLQLGLAHLRGGSLEEGVTHLRGVRGILGKPSFNYLTHLGWEQVLANRDVPEDERDWQLAERFYRAAVALNPKDQRAHTALIELYLYWSKDSVGAATALRDAVASLANSQIEARFAPQIRSLQRVEKTIANAPDSSLPLQSEASQEEWPVPRHEGLAPEGAKLDRTVHRTRAGTWTRPVLLFETSDIIAEPFLLADSEDRVHCLWRWYREETHGYALWDSIYFSRLEHNVWSKPIQLIGREFMLKGGAFSHAHISPALVSPDRLLVLWSGPLAQKLFRTVACARATDPAAWGITRLFGKNSGGYSTVVGDSRGRLHAIYSKESRNLRQKVSVDGGNHWSPSWLVAESVGGGGVDFLKGAISSDDTLHLVWTEFELPRGWPPLGVFYSRSSNLGRTWTEPLELAGANYVQGNIAVGPGDDVHVVYNALASIKGRYHRVSWDGGRTWSSPRTITNRGGMEGPPQIGFDRWARPHVVTTGWTDVLYSVFEEGHWKDPVRLAGTDSRETGWHEQPAMAIQDGRIIHTVYWDFRRRLYHRSLELED